MSNFHVGQVVVCVSRFKNDGVHLTRRFPQPKNIYTIRETELIGESLGLRLEEIVNPVERCRWPDGTEEMTEAAFSALRFRPAVKTDISIFTEMLNKQTDEVRA